MSVNSNLASSFPYVPTEPRNASRSSSARGRANAQTPIVPIRTFDSGAAKVWLQDVSLRYKTEAGAELLALDRIDLKVRQGEFLCIVGPSGCGKSTLLHLIAALQKPSSGSILIDDATVIGPGTDRILIFQEHGLFPWLTVGENVAFGMKMKGLSKAEREERTRHYLRLVHLSQFKDSRPHQLSGGMRQRVALARALATEPDVLLMDEPFAALDAQTRDLLHDELERIWAETGRTIIFVTHNVREAVRLGDRVVVLSFRPGRVKSEYAIDLPRPRDVAEVRLTPRFIEIHTRIWHAMKAEVLKSYARQNQ